MSVEKVAQSTDFVPAPAGLQEKSSAYRWLILLFAWLAYLVSFIDRLIWTSVNGMAAESYGLSLATLGVFVTAFYAGYVISQLLTGFVSDWLGPRLMLVLALLPLGALTFAFGFTTTLTAGLALQALMGLAAGADFAAGVKLIISWFGVAERGRAMGIYMTSTSLGVVVTNAVVPRALLLMPWTTVYQVAGIITAVLGIACFLALRDNPGGAEAPPFHWRNVGMLARSRQYVFIVLAGAGGVWGTWGYAIWASALMRKALNFPALTAGGIVAVFGIAAVVAKPIIGIVSDMMGGRRKALVMASLLCFAALLVVTGLLRTPIAFWLIAPLLGFTAFSYSPLSNTMAAEAGGAVAASAAGISAAVGSLGAMVVPMVVGVGFQTTGSYEVAFLILAAGPLLGALCMLPVHDIGVRPSERRRAT